MKKKLSKFLSVSVNKKKQWAVIQVDEIYENGQFIKPYSKEEKLVGGSYVEKLTLNISKQTAKKLAKQLQDFSRN